MGREWVRGRNSPLLLAILIRLFRCYFLAATAKIPMFAMGHFLAFSKVRKIDM